MGAGEIPQWLRLHTTLAEDTSSTLSPHIGKLATIGTPASEDLMSYSGLSGQLYSHAHNHTDTQIHEMK